MPRCKMPRAPLVLCGGGGGSPLHLAGQVLVLVSDDGQGGLLAQGAGAVPEGLLRGGGRGAAANLLLPQTVAALVGPWPGRGTTTHG